MEWCSAIEKRICRAVSFFACIVFVLMPLQPTLAVTMTSSNYQVQHGTFGSGGTPTSSSENYSQSSNMGESVIGDQSTSGSNQSSAGFGEVLGTTSSTSTSNEAEASTTGGGGFADDDTHITARNEPLVLPSSEYSGTLTQEFAEDHRVIVDVPSNSVSNEVTITVERISVSAVSELTSGAASLISGDLFRITARDANGVLITDFLEEMTIVITIPDMPEDTSNVGLYHLDEEAFVWRFVDTATFGVESVTFTTDHFTDFALFEITGLPPVLAAVLSLFGFDELPGTLPAAPSDTDVEEEVPQLPEQLFDITLTIDDRVLTSVRELVARLTFTSFGRVPTPVDVTFSILDEEGNEVYRDEGEAVDITVETEGLLTKTFEEIELLPGTYRLVAVTRYDENIVDEFSQQFEIREQRSIISFIQLSLGFLFIFLLLFTWYRERHATRTKNHV